MHLALSVVHPHSFRFFNNPWTFSTMVSICFSSSESWPQAARTPWRAKRKAGNSWEFASFWGKPLTKDWHINTRAPLHLMKKTLNCNLQICTRPETKFPGWDFPWYHALAWPNSLFSPISAKSSLFFLGIFTNELTWILTSESTSGKVSLRHKLLIFNFF